MIQILIASRDDTNTSEEDDNHIDKLLTDANRTRRCFRSQTKMLKNGDPEQAIYTARLRLLDTLLTALETDWSSLDRSSPSDEFSVDETSLGSGASNHSRASSHSTRDQPRESQSPRQPQQLSQKSSGGQRPQLMRTSGNIKLVRVR